MLAQPCFMGLLWDLRAVPHPVPTLHLAGCWGAWGYGQPAAFGWDPAAVLCVSPPSREVQPFVSTWLAPVRSRGSDGLKGFYSFSEVWLERDGKRCVGDMRLSRCEPGRGQAAGTGSIPPQMEASFGDALCTRAEGSDSSIHQVSLDAFLAREGWGFHSCAACLTEELCVLRGTRVMSRAERRAFI